MSMMHRADIAVVGSGFGGTLMAMVAQKQGHSVVLVEKGTHPRFGQLRHTAGGTSLVTG